MASEMCVIDIDGHVIPTSEFIATWESICRKAAVMELLASDHAEEAE